MCQVFVTLWEPFPLARAQLSKGFQVQLGNMVFDICLDPDMPFHVELLDIKIYGS